MTKLRRRLPGLVRRARRHCAVTGLAATILTACVRAGARPPDALPPTPARETHVAADSISSPPDTTPGCPRTPAQQVLQLINRRRAEVGLLPLRLDARLVAAAREHAEDLARGAPFGHQGSDGSEPKDRVVREGYHYLATGENVAAGMTSAPVVVADWMGSKPHRDNILSGYQDTGIAYVHMRFSMYGSYWVQVFGTLQAGQASERITCNP